MFEKLRSSLSKLFTKSVTIIRTVPEAFLGSERWRTDNFYKLAEEGYQSNVTVFRCVQIIAMACSGIPFLLYRKKEEGTEELEVHPLLNLIRRPNNLMGQAKFIETMISNLLISGNSFIYGAGPDDLNKPPQKLYVLRPDCVSINEGQLLDEVEYYEYYDDKRKITIPTERILHLKLYNPLNNWYGMSPLIAAAINIDHKNTGVTWNYQLIKNGARPQGALVTDQTLSDAQYNNLKIMLDEHSGSAKVGRPLLLEGGLHWEELSINPKDMDWLSGIKLDTREIAIAFGVPPQLVGDNENMTYSNYQEARKALYQETVIPLMKWIRDELNVWFTPKYGDPKLYLDINTDDIDVLQEDREKAWERVGKAVDRGILDRNEARDALGYERKPDKGMDTIYLPFSLAPISGGNSEETNEEENNQKKSLELKGRRLVDSEEKQIKRWETKRRGIWDPFENKWKKELKAYFKKQKEEVIKNFTGKKTSIRESDLFNHEEWDRILILLASPLLTKIIEAGIDDSANELGITVIWGIFNRRVGKWVDNECGTKIKGINDTTLKNLRDTLSKGMEAGEGINDLANRIEEVFDQATGYRAENIARTETIRGYRQGNAELYRESGVVEEIEIWTALDERVCEICMSYHGKRMSIDEFEDWSANQHPSCRCDGIPILMK